MYKSLAVLGVLLLLSTGAARAQSPSPETMEATPSVLVIETSALGVRVMVSVDVLSAWVLSPLPAGQFTLAVLTRLPVADGLIVAVTV